MNTTTISVLNDLQENLDNIKKLNSNIEVVWQLEKLKEKVDIANELILKSI